MAIAVEPMGGHYARLPTETPPNETPPNEPRPGEPISPASPNSAQSDFSRQVSSRGSGPCGFVDAGWFQCVAACVIVANTAMVVFEATGGKSTEERLYIPEQVMLGFYVFELLARVCHFRGNFLCGPCRLVSWNILDLVVVVAGVFDQWVVPVLPVQPGPDAARLKSMLQCFRLFRLVRAIKIVRIFFEADLSWTEGARFQSFVGAIIAMNALLMGFETDVDWQGWAYFEQVFLVVYVFELSVRLKRWGCRFFYHETDLAWNLLDFTIVVSSVLDTWLIPLISLVTAKISQGSGDGEKDGKGGGLDLGQGMMLMRMLRLMRILRLARLVKSVRPLYNLVQGVLVAMQGVAWVLVLTIVTLYAMGILTTRLIGHGLLLPPNVLHSEETQNLLAAFGTVADSMFMLFKLMNGAQSDSDGAAIDFLMSELPSIKFAFVFFMITSSWTLLSILTAVVSENMITTTSAAEQDLKLEKAEEDRRSHINALKELFIDIDTNQDGTTSQEELEAHFADPTKAVECARACRIPARDVVQVLTYLSQDGEAVAVDQFVESLTEVGNVATEKSIMKLEGKLLHLQSETVRQWVVQQEQLKAMQGQLQEVLPLLTEMSKACKVPPEPLVLPRTRQEEEEERSKMLSSMQEMLRALEKRVATLAIGDDLRCLSEAVRSMEGRFEARLAETLSSVERRLEAPVATGSDLEGRLETCLTNMLGSLEERVASTLQRSLEGRAESVEPASEDTQRARQQALVASGSSSSSEPVAAAPPAAAGVGGDAVTEPAATPASSPMETEAAPLVAKRPRTLSIDTNASGVSRTLSIDTNGGSVSKNPTQAASAVNPMMALLQKTFGDPDEPPAKPGPVPASEGEVPLQGPAAQAVLPAADVLAAEAAAELVPVVAEAIVAAEAVPAETEPAPESAQAAEAALPSDDDPPVAAAAPTTR